MTSNTDSAPTLEQLTANLRESVRQLPESSKRKLMNTMTPTAFDADLTGAVDGVLTGAHHTAAALADDGLRAFTLEQISELYGVEMRTLRRYVKAGTIRAAKFGRRYMITAAALREFLQASGTRARQAQG